MFHHVSLRYKLPIISRTRVKTGANGMTTSMTVTSLGISEKDYAQLIWNVQKDYVNGCFCYQRLSSFKEYLSYVLYNALRYTGYPRCMNPWEGEDWVNLWWWCCEWSERTISKARPLPWCISKAVEILSLGQPWNWFYTFLFKQTRLTKTECLGRKKSLKLVGFMG